MKKTRTFFLLGIAFFAASGVYLLRPHPKYREQLDWIKEIDAKYYSIKSPITQTHALLPHARPRYYPLALQRRNPIERTSLLQQTTASLSDLLRDASATQKRLKSFLTAFAKDFPDSRLYIPAIKGMGTIRTLLETRWDGDASMITDYSRATISFPTLEQMYEALEKLKASGMLILQVSDHFATPCLGGYRDITVVFRDFANGHLGELQLNLNSIMEFKNGLGTELFHVIRTLLAIPKKEHRSLTQEEEICLEHLFQMERSGYEAALGHVVK